MGNPCVLSMPMLPENWNTQGPTSTKTQSSPCNKPDMPHPLLYAWPGQETLAAKVSALADLRPCHLSMRNFPDGETYVRVDTNVRDCVVYLLVSLDRPDIKFLPLYFMAQTLKAQGAAAVCLIAPYLCYMRQDKQFKPGECVSAEQFALLLGHTVDELITVDPHLHRHQRLEELYSIPCTTLHAAPVIAAWLTEHIPTAVLVGPDEESKQWVAGVAECAGVPYMHLLKTRLADRDVRIEAPDAGRWLNRRPVLVDDILSTGKTLLEATRVLHEAGYRDPACIAVHGIFAGDAFAELRQVGLDLYTSDSVSHETNAFSSLR
ncbi:MAG: ribose-phosphate diphosphokinase [Sphingobacteriales bacterium]|nr:MAG: ribose-phosphate diphosphokinase [Sphingobacteriales bacterium]